MAYTSQVPVPEHEVIKAQKFVNSIIGVLEREVTLPQTFARKNIDVFKGSEGDTVTQRFPGRLPWREYTFRNDRTDPIVFDVLTEATASITVGDRIYSATRLTDEQRDFDDLTIEQLTPIMADAVVTGINSKATAALESTVYPVTIGGAEANLRSAILEARRVVNALKVPVPNRYLAVGPDFEIALLTDENIVLAQNAGDRRADNALSDAVLGRLYGFTVVLDQNLEPGTAIAYQGDSFALYSGAASVPRGVLGAVKSYGGYGLRLVRDYELTRYVERAAVDTYLGIAPILDQLVTPVAAANGANGLVQLSEERHFVRGLKLTLDGTSVYPEATGEVALFSEGQVSDAKPWTP